MFDFFNIFHVHACRDERKSGQIASLVEPFECDDGMGKQFLEVRESLACERCEPSGGKKDREISKSRKFKQNVFS